MPRRREHRDGPGKERFPDGRRSLAGVSLPAVYAFELAQVFNEFYHECPVLKSELVGYRLALVQVFRSVIGKCLDLMSIEKIEET